MASWSVDTVLGAGDAVLIAKRGRGPVVLIGLAGVDDDIPEAGDAPPSDGVRRSRMLTDDCPEGWPPV